jgi:hypothetical protein
MVVLQMEGICDVRRYDGFMRHDMLIKFHEDWYRRSNNIKVLPEQFESLYVGIADGRDL